MLLCRGLISAYLFVRLLNLRGESRFDCRLEARNDRACTTHRVIRRLLLASRWVAYLLLSTPARSNVKEILDLITSLPHGFWRALSAVLLPEQEESFIICSLRMLWLAM